MKRYIWLLAAAMTILLFGCETDRTTADPAYDENTEITYTIREILQFDPININGIDLIDEFDFFSTFGFTLYRTEGKFTSLEIIPGDVPFSAYDFELPAGKVDCYLATDTVPYELRLKDSDNVVAYFKNGEFYVPFQLDCVELSYQYRFREVK